MAAVEVTGAVFFMDDGGVMMKTGAEYAEILMMTNTGSRVGLEPHVLVTRGSDSIRVLSDAIGHDVLFACGTDDGLTEEGLK